jgi:hypothetical protein
MVNQNSSQQEIGYDFASSHEKAFGVWVYGAQTRIVFSNELARVVQGYSFCHRKKLFVVPKLRLGLKFGSGRRG